MDLNFLNAKDVYIHVSPKRKVPTTEGIYIHPRLSMLLFFHWHSNFVRYCLKGCKKE